LRRFGQTLERGQILRRRSHRRWWVHHFEDRARDAFWFDRDIAFKGRFDMREILYAVLCAAPSSVSVA
jgi:hypothetical protein